MYPECDTNYFYDKRGRIYPALYVQCNSIEENAYD